MGSLVGVLAPVAAVVALVASCGQRGNPADTDGTQMPPSGDACATPNEGCPCDSPGQVVDCGEVSIRSGDHVSCSMGTRACIGTKWGACNGTHIVTKAVPSGGSLHGLALTQGPCPATGPLSNPCDPYCHQVVDDGGISIAPAPPSGACQYYLPADAAASYAAIPAAWRANPAGACSTGTSDPCGHDGYCPTGAGCTFPPAGSTNPGCGGWDLTFPTPCDNAGVETFVICNRGSSPANTGVLSGVVVNASLQGQPSDVSLFKPPVSAPRLGTCTFDLVANPIAPGTCKNFTIASACPGADFTSAGGLRTIQWNMPDWGAPGDPARISGECIDKNNFTVYAQGALLACQGIGCAGGAGGVTLKTNTGGDSTCPPGPNLHTGACNAGNQYTVCQQDFRCDIPSGACVWNGGEGWFDPGVAGVDLTTGAPCSDPADVFPVCNRGSGTLAAGTPVNIHIGGPAPIADSCAPGPVTCTANVPAGDLGPGKCFNIPCNVSGNNYATVSTTGEAPGLCANNQTYAKTNGAPGCAACTLCDTRVSGKVYDPSSGTPPIAGANNLPLAGIGVFQPSGALTPFVDGVACDTCTSVDSPSVTKAVTDAAGDFVMHGVTPGPATRVVVQSGRWRREITVPVTACADNTFPAGTFRMPRNRTDGNGGVADIPKTAIVTGSLESLECMMLKLGISTSEIGGSTGPGDLKRFEIFRHNGMNTTPAAPASTTLYSAANLGRFTAVLNDCPSSGNNDKSAAARTEVRNFVDAGGRVFLDHWPGFYTLGSAEFPATMTLTGGDVPGGLPAAGRVLTGTPPQVLFDQWLNNVGATTDYGAGWVRVDEARRNLGSPVAGTVLWIAGRNNDSWGAGAPPAAPTNPSDYILSYSFETPFPGGTCGGGGTGRVIYNGMHVAPGRKSGNSFPANCNLGGALAPEEKALTYQFFQLTACQLGGNPPPPPPPSIPPATFSRDFEGICPIGTYPEWQFFQWQSDTPPGTNITFRAATADDQASLPASPPVPPSPTTVGAGTASGAAVLDPNWASDAQTIAWHLANDPPGRAELSKRWLRVYMTFNPIGAVPPTLYAWRQDYSCKPAE